MIRNRIKSIYKVMLRYLKYLAWIFLAYFLAKILFSQLFDNRPFMFERYKSSREISNVLQERFPVGSNADRIVSVLTKSGARCFERCFRGFCVDGNREIDCSYRSDFLLVYPPFPCYSVKIVLDKDRSITDIAAIKQAGLIFGT